MLQQDVDKKLLKVAKFALTSQEGKDLAGNLRSSGAVSAFAQLTAIPKKSPITKQIFSALLNEKGLSVVDAQDKYARGEIGFGTYSQSIVEQGFSPDITDVIVEEGVTLKKNFEAGTQAGLDAGNTLAPGQDIGDFAKAGTQSAIDKQNQELAAKQGGNEALVMQRQQGSQFQQAAAPQGRQSLRQVAETRPRQAPTQPNPDTGQQELPLEQTKPTEAIPQVNFDTMTDEQFLQIPPDSLPPNQKDEFIRRTKLIAQARIKSKKFNASFQRGR